MDYLLAGPPAESTGSGSSDTEGPGASCCRLALCSVALTGVLALGALAGASLGYEVGLNMSFPRVNTSFLPQAPFNGSELMPPAQKIEGMLGIGAGEAPRLVPEDDDGEAVVTDDSKSEHDNGGDRGREPAPKPTTQASTPATTPAPTPPPPSPPPSPVHKKKPCLEEITKEHIENEDEEWAQKQPLWRMEEAEWRMRNNLNATTFYMYRAQSDKEYPEVNVNMADLSGVLWYLHHEIVRITPRKYDVTRIMRFKVTVKNTEALYHGMMHKFAPFVAFDAGKCTVPTCDTIWNKYGFVVGCQVIVGDFSTYTRQRPCELDSQATCRGGIWFSLPGPCPNMDYLHKSDACIKGNPGGECGNNFVTGAPDCTYHVEKAGWVDLNEYTFIYNYTDFIDKGLKEYDPDTDKGVKFTFWDGMKDKAKCRWRLNRLELMFKEKFPDLPAVLDPPACPG